MSCSKEKQQIQERDEDTLFGELITSQLRKIGLPDKLVIKMKINLLIYDHQVRASTAVKDNWERKHLNSKYFPHYAKSSNPTGW